MADILVVNKLDEVKRSVDGILNKVGGSSNNLYKKIEYRVLCDTETTHTFATPISGMYITNTSNYCQIELKVNDSTDYIIINNNSTILIDYPVNKLMLRSYLTASDVVIEYGVTKEIKNVNQKTLFRTNPFTSTFVHSALKNRILMSNNCTVYISEDGGKTRNQVYKTRETFDDYIENGFISEWNKDKMIIFTNLGEIHTSIDGGVNWVKCDTSTIPDIKSPFVNACVWRNNTIVFAEYGTRTGTYRVFKSTDNGVTWKIVLSRTNSTSDIRHFHSVDYLRHSNTWIITSGDQNTQVRWWKSTDDCETLTEITGVNSQRYRTCRIIEISPNEIMWGSDGVSMLTEICKAKLNDVVATTESITDLNKTIFGLHKNGQDILAMTSTEVSDYQDNLATLYLSRDNGNSWNRIAEAEVTISAGGFRGCVGVTSNGEFVVQTLKLDGFDKRCVYVKPL